MLSHPSCRVWASLLSSHPSHPSLSQASQVSNASSTLPSIQWSSSCESPATEAGSENLDESCSSCLSEASQVSNASSTTSSSRGSHSRIPRASSLWVHMITLIYFTHYLSSLLSIVQAGSQLSICFHPRPPVFDCILQVIKTGGGEGLRME